jgi:hypothetical protein
MSRRTGIARRLAVSLIGMGLLAPIALHAQQVPPEVSCLERAQDETRLPEQQRERLCLGTASLEPIACFREALDETTLGAPEAVDLCRCSASTEPVQCFRAALKVRPDEPLWAVRQCSPIAVQNLTADCRSIVPTDPGLR